MHYYLALGSNMGDRRSNIRKALNFLKTVGTVSAVSAVYETEPVGMTEDAENFYNLALSFQCNLSPEDLLKTVKAFEKQMGRDIAGSHYKPRIIDIDILLAENRIITTEFMAIPHKEMHKRGFVLVPLNEIAPEAIHPILNKKIKELLSNLYTGEQFRPVYSYKQDFHDFIEEHKL